MPGQERGRRASFRRSLVGIVALLVLNGALVRCSLSPRLPRSSSPNRPFSLIAPSAETLPAPTVLPSPAPFSPSLTVWLPQVAVRATRPATPLYTYRVVRQYPHDPEAFTQGLVYLDGLLYESTGLYGRSSVRQVELETGR
ncbi:MAG: glutaminyl-peptide cyclotransferase, partial [Chloroflexi bacterium]|nr:glutaminyl-peptide cyclotransferase [Chloroflexota bacterium]